MKNKIIKILFVVSIILLLIPSIVYIIANKTIYKFENYYTYTLTNNFTNFTEGIMYLGVFAIISILYILILKNHGRMFKNVKQMGIYIIIVSMLFACVLPNTSSDIYYYIGVGRIQNVYNANPYYESINSVIEKNEQAKYDKILQNTPECWRDITVVYGPVWTLICNILTLISFNSVDYLLCVFKIFNLTIHLLNCYIIYKITKKKIFTIIYGLNPLILIETLANVHNDIVIVFLILLALYFLLKKKNIILSVVFLSIAAGIKYITLLLLPFVLIYYFRKEKINIRIYKCAKYGILFIIVLALFYLIYARDLSILNGLVDQQGKYSKSVALCLYYLTENCHEVFSFLKDGIFILFVMIYIAIVVWQILKKDVKFYKAIRKFNTTLLIFMFLVLSTFQPWYIVWIFPVLMWQKPKMQKTLIYMTLMTCLANSVFVFYSEAAIYGKKFVLLMIFSGIVSTLLSLKITKKGDNLIGKG